MVNARPRISDKGPHHHEGKSKEMSTTVRLRRCEIYTEVTPRPSEVRMLKIDSLMQSVPSFRIDVYFGMVLRTSWLVGITGDRKRHRSQSRAHRHPLIPEPWLHRPDDLHVLGCGNKQYWDMQVC